MIVYLYLVFYRDCLALCVLNSTTSIFAGFVVFSILGFMSQQLGLSMEEIASSGKYYYNITCSYYIVIILCSHHMSLLIWDYHGYLLCCCQPQESISVQYLGMVQSLNYLGMALSNKVKEEIHMVNIIMDKWCSLICSYIQVPEINVFFFCIYGFCTMIYLVYYIHFSNVYMLYFNMPETSSFPDCNYLF